jgi:peptidoglycan hydrolase-like protein with peptidoglycan-binding domain
VIGDLRRAARRRALRRQSEEQRRELAGLVVELERVGAARPEVVERRLENIAALDRQLSALEPGRAAASKPEASPPAPDQHRADAAREPQTPPASGLRLVGAGAAAGLAALLVVLVFKPFGNSQPAHRAATPAVARAGRPAHGGRVPRRHRHARRTRSTGRHPKLSARGLGTAVLSPGSRGKEVRLLQRLLHVQTTGIYGPATTAAVRRFQRRHALPTTGVTGKLTHAALLRAFP